MRTELFPAAILLSAAAFGQEVYVSHAFPGACGGGITVNGADSVHWSTGDTGPVLLAPPGTYGLEVYVDGAIVMEGTRTIELNGWEFELTTIPSWDGLQISGPVSVQHCGTSIFNVPCCTPDPEQTTVFVLQDGQPYTPTGTCMGCTDVFCAYTLVMITGLPYGHVYNVGLNDPTCAGAALSMDILAPSCANLELVTVVTATQPGQATGSIVVEEAIPDPTEPLPIEAPVAGMFLLIDLGTQTPIGPPQTGTSAEWTGLAAGTYGVQLVPDAGCQAALDTVVVTDGLNTGLAGSPTGPRLGIAPSVTDAWLQVSGGGAAPVHVRIIDPNGRVVREVQVPPSSPIAVGALAPGTYVAELRQGDVVERVRFVRR